MNLPELPPDFDPNGMALSDGLFGLPFKAQDARLVIVPVPWEATVSYREGTARSLPAIVEASWQVDLYDPMNPDGWKNGIALAKPDGEILAMADKARDRAVKHLERLEKGKTSPEHLDKVNEACALMVENVRKQCAKLLDKGHKVGLLGGDHSTPLGFLKALAERHPQFGVLQIDAHLDLRKAYEGFEYSHASIMYNALKINEIEKLVQVGIRDYCDEERDRVMAQPGRIAVFYDRDLKRRQFEGIRFSEIASDIVSQLPQKVYISFDIDGLDPSLCPNTGTPVPGGLLWDEALYLLEAVLHSGRSIIGFDLNEVVATTGEDWDAMVGSRLLYRLANLSLLNE